jgi:uncharacterized protein
MSATPAALPVARSVDEHEQYSLATILSMWAAVSLPMALLAWVVGPLSSPHLPLHPGITHWLLMIAGMIWQTVVALVILRRELGSLHWKVLRKRLWLNLPRDPRTGRTRARLFGGVVPPLLFSFATGVVVTPYVDAPVTTLFPALQMPARMDISRLADPQFAGQWWLLGVALISSGFNYLLGEELFFRGYCCRRCAACSVDGIGSRTPFSSASTTCISRGHCRASCSATSRSRGQRGALGAPGWR